MRRAYDARWTGASAGGLSIIGGAKTNHAAQKTKWPPRQPRRSRR
jgi:hypothetical protein